MQCLRKLKYIQHYTLKFRKFFATMFILSSNEDIWKTFQHNNLSRKIKNTVEGESNGELRCLDFLLKLGNDYVLVQTLDIILITMQAAKHHVRKCNFHLFITELIQV